MADSILPVSRYCDYGGLIASLMLEIQFALLVDIQTHTQITERERRLKRLGIPAYGLYWLNGYLYLAHPKTASKPRHRTYVGPKPELIEREYAAIERKKQYKRLIEEKKALERRAYRVARALSNIIRATKKEI